MVGFVKSVAARLERVLRQDGLRVAVLRPSISTFKRELWYERRLKDGVEVVICHPKPVETGLDLFAFPTLHFYKTGYSLHTLRHASRRVVAHRTEAAGRRLEIDDDVMSAMARELVERWGGDLADAVVGILMAWSAAQAPWGV